MDNTLNNVSIHLVLEINGFFRAKKGGNLVAHPIQQMTNGYAKATEAVLNTFHQAEEH